ncbi:histidine kinase [Actinoplanes sp. NEAU-A12]|uniref:histidine kinase n=1 Tax=Actinoplanes sandaracinus TaxID=3045177 RepID=A0ABT6WKK7_9ACTN|nr:histidine kinase [Actinoplanes sandaracinus]MDI6100190.1 histidine kinase [Actinoplanes sandaracinus]
MLPIDQVRGLVSAAPQPLPPMTGPRPARWLPHLLVVLSAGLLGLTGADQQATLLAGLHAVTLVVALRWPVAAWWLSTVILAAIPALHPPTPSNQSWAWVVHAGVLLLVALRNPPAVAAVAAVVSGLAAVGLKLAGSRIGSWEVVETALVMFALAAVVGGALRSRRRARERLAGQQELTARERSQRMLLEERARIARELHDVVAHHMSLVAIQADAAPHRVTSPPEELVAAFGSIRGSALEALTELRRVLGVLRDGGPAPDRPQPGLDQLDDVFTQVRAAGLDVTATVNGPRRRLSPSVELSAFRIVQEALSNALRHAPGSRVAVEIVYSAAALRIRVVNGPSPHPVRHTDGAGHGVLGMRERAAMLGGELSAGPTQAGGYEVAALLPDQEDPK